MSLNKIMLKATPMTHQTMRNLLNGVGYAADQGIEPRGGQHAEADADPRVRQEGIGHTRGPPFVWAWPSLSNRGATQWVRERPRA